MWIPTSKSSVSLKQTQPLVSRPKARFLKQHYSMHTEGQHKKRMTVQSFWQHFDDEDEAWPKVVLHVTSTERTVTPRKTKKKTFASYFPYLDRRYTATENTKSEYQNDDEEDDADEATPKFKDLATNWILNNSGKNGDNFMLLEEENDNGMEEAENKIEVKRRIYALTTTTKNSSNIERNEKKLLTITTKRSRKKEQITKTELTRTKKARRKTKLTTKLAPFSLVGAPKYRRKSNFKSRVRCYQCGLNNEKIPQYPTCSHIFSPVDRTFFSMRNSHKVRCVNSFKGKFHRYKHHTVTNSMAKITLILAVTIKLCSECHKTTIWERRLEFD